MTLAAEEFMRRFLLYAVPDGSIASAMSGPSPTATAPRNWLRSAARCSRLPRRSRRRAESYRELTTGLTGRDLKVCPDCGGTLRERSTVAPATAAARAVVVR